MSAAVLRVGVRGRGAGALAEPRELPPVQALAEHGQGGPVLLQPGPGAQLLQGPRAAVADFAFCRRSVYLQAILGKRPPGLVREAPEDFLRREDHVLEWSHHDVLEPAQLLKIQVLPQVLVVHVHGRTEVVGLRILRPDGDPRSYVVMQRLGVGEARLVPGRGRAKEAGGEAVGLALPRRHLRDGAADRDDQRGVRQVLQLVLEQPLDLLGAVQGVLPDDVVQRPPVPGHSAGPIELHHLHP
mmetsp:Transcript_79553/g.233891  ORF Transcript_79553/g.233891 Transcript_79553/m.233891 type:complete len:242 (-) Transcript_79553:307-1032(-)